MEFHNKENVLFKHYKEILESRSFDEFDIFGFLIFIRPYVAKQYQKVKEFCDLMAHRKRDRGAVMGAISGAIKNHYKTITGSKHVAGYHGFQDVEWSKEWKRLLSELGVNCSNELLYDLTLCIYSLVQDSQYDNNTWSGTIELFQDQNGMLSLCTTEGKSDSVYVCFALYGPYEFQYMFPAGHITESVETYRHDGILHLRTLSGVIIV